MNNVKILDDFYVLRYAAGQYWLLDTLQPGVPYKGPLRMNAMGAEIWNLLEKRYSTEQIISTLGAEYEAAPTEIKADVLQFINQLKIYGVKIEE